jgi:hypothetical protein
LDVQRLAARWREASAVVGGRGAAAARDGELELALRTLPTALSRFFSSCLSRIIFLIMAAC